MRRSAVLLLLGFTSSSHATVVTWVDLVDPSDNITQPPPGVVAVDVMVTSPQDDLWTASGMRGVVTPVGRAEGVSIR